MSNLVNFQNGITPLDAANLNTLSAMPTSTSGTNNLMPWRAAALPSTNLNSITAPGFYRITAATTNSPVTTGTLANSAVLHVMPTASTRITQVMYHNNNITYVRTLQNTVWTPWRQLGAGGGANGGNTNVFNFTTTAWNSWRAVPAGTPSLLALQVIFSGFLVNISLPMNSSTISQAVFTNPLGGQITVSAQVNAWSELDIVFGGSISGTPTIRGAYFSQSQ